MANERLFTSMSDTTNTDDDGNEQSSDDDVITFETGIVLVHDDGRWRVLETSRDVESAVHYVIGKDERRQRVTLRTSIGEPKSENDD